MVVTTPAGYPASLMGAAHRTRHVVQLREARTHLWKPAYMYMYMYMYMAELHIHIHIHIHIRISGSQTSVPWQRAPLSVTDGGSANTCTKGAWVATRCQQEGRARGVGDRLTYCAESTASTSFEAHVLRHSTAILVGEERHSPLVARAAQSLRLSFASHRKALSQIPTLHPL